MCGLVGASSAGSAIATALTDGGTTYVHQFENTGVSAVGPLGGGYAYRTASGSRWAATLTPTYTSVSTGFTHHQGQFVEVSTTSPATECRGFYYSYRPLPTGSVTIAMRVDSMTGPGPCAAPIGTNVVFRMWEALPVAKSGGYDLPAANGIWAPSTLGSSGPRRAWPTWIVQRSFKLFCVPSGRIVPVGAVLSPLRFRANPTGGFAIGVLADGCEFEATSLNVAPGSMPF